MIIKRKHILIFLFSIIIIYFIWFLNQPKYIELEIPFPPDKKTSWGYISHTIVTEMEWNGGGTYYVVRYDGIARLKDGWTEKKVENHFDTWLKKLGYEEKRVLELGPFYDYANIQNAMILRYVKSAKNNYERIYLTVWPENCGKDIDYWYVRLETVKDSFFTNFFDD